MNVEDIFDSAQLNWMRDEFRPAAVSLLRDRGWGDAVECSIENNIEVEFIPSAPNVCCAMIVVPLEAEAICDRGYLRRIPTCFVKMTLDEYYIIDAGLQSLIQELIDERGGGPLTSPIGPEDATFYEESKMVAVNVGVEIKIADLLERIAQMGLGQIGH